MSQNDSKYLPELMAEKDSIDPSFVHALRLITQEIEKIKNPSSSPAKSEKNLLDVVSGRPTKIECDIRVPVESHPNINFVGRLIGPGGSTMKGIQEVTGTRMAVLGKGTVREKDRKKVEESRERNDPKYQHLDYPLHVHVSALGEVPQAYMNLGRACAEIQKLLHIDEDTEAQFAAVQSMGQGMRGGGRGGGMANPGGFRGRGGGPGRGGQRGGRGGMSRGGASGRGAASGRGMGAGMGGASSRGAARGGVRGRGAGRGQAQAYAQMKPVQEAYTDEYGYESYGAAAATAAATAGYDATGYEGYEESYDQSYDAAYGAEAAAYGDAAYVESYEDYGYGAESYDAYGNGSSAAVKPSFGVPGGSFRGKMRGGMRGRQKPY